MEPGTNHVISTLNEADLNLMKSYLQPVELPQRTFLERRGKPINHVYFLARGFASLVIDARESVSVEVGLIGNDGLTGLSVVLGASDPAYHDTFMQVGGAGLEISAEHLRKCLAKSSSLHGSLLVFINRFLVQVARTAAANARSTIEERLARWLLLADDRLNAPMPLTHEFLAMMLGVHRPGVTLALGQLEQQGFITRGRGEITIVDRPGLVAYSKGAYDPQIAA